MRVCFTTIPTGTQSAYSTNITEAPGKYTSTRGELASSFLLPRRPTARLRDEVDRLVSENGTFAGFNLLLLAPRLEHTEGADRVHFDSAFVTNSGGGGRITARILSEAERRCGGLSNGIDSAGANEWSKVEKGKQALQDVLETAAEGMSESELAERLFELLTWVPHAMDPLFRAFANIREGLRRKLDLRSCARGPCRAPQYNPSRPYRRSVASDPVIGSQGVLRHSPGYRVAYPQRWERLLCRTRRVDAGSTWGCREGGRQESSACLPLPNGSRH